MADRREPSETDQQAAIEGIVEYDTGVHVTPIPRSASPEERVRHEIRIEAFRRERGDRDLRKRIELLAQDMEARFTQRDQTISALSLEISQVNVHMFGYRDAEGRGRFGQLEQQMLAQAARIEQHARTFEKLERLQFKIIVSASLAGSAVAIVISAIEWIVTH